MSQSDVCVAIVSYNTSEKLRRCLRAIEPDHAVIVVDNASTDGSPEMVEQEFPNALLVRNLDNRGFGQANNQAMALADRPLILFLNSDAYADPGAIDLLARVFSDEKVVAAGGQLLNPDGTLQQSTANELTLWSVFCEQFYLEKAFKKSRIFNGYWNTQVLAARDGNSATEQVMGACLMMRRDTERFNERFFLYAEDTDLCKRLRRKGEILYVPEAKFVHDLGSSSGSNPVRGVARYNRGKELYFEIHHGRIGALCCLALDRLGALSRCLFWCCRSLVSRNAGSKAVARGFWQVFTAPMKGPTRS